MSDDDGIPVRPVFVALTPDPRDQAEIASLRARAEKAELERDGWETAHYALRSRVLALAEEWERGSTRIDGYQIGEWLGPRLARALREAVEGK